MLTISFIWIHTLSWYVWIHKSMNSHIFAFVWIHILLLTYEFISFLFVYEFIYLHLCLNSYTITIIVAPYGCTKMVTTNTSNDNVPENCIEASMNKIFVCLPTWILGYQNLWWLMVINPLMFLWLLRGIFQLSLLESPPPKESNILGQSIVLMKTFFLVLMLRNHFAKCSNLPTALMDASWRLIV